LSGYERLSRYSSLNQGKIASPTLFDYGFTTGKQDSALKETSPKPILVKAIVAHKEAVAI
jgi:hypothetical protein